MKKWLIILLAVLLSMGSAQATKFDAFLEWNGTNTFDFLLEDENIVNIQHFEANGTGFVRILYDDGHSEIRALAQYIQANEPNWNNNNPPSSSIHLGDIVGYVKDGIDWWIWKLNGGNGQKVWASDLEKELIYQLMRLFPTWADYNKLQRENEMLRLRLDTLERAMEEIYPQEYCNEKLVTMLEYNMTGVICQFENHTTSYHNHMIHPSTGEDMIIGITPA